MPSNEGKWKVFQNAVGLDGPPGVRQNLNGDLQTNLGNELDHVLRRHQGSCVASWEGWEVAAGAGLSVTVSTGVGFVDGQIVGGGGSVASLPASTANIKIYVQAGTPWGNPASQWPAVFGHTTGVLVTTRLLLALVTTSGSAVTSVTDQRVWTSTVTEAINSLSDALPAVAHAESFWHRFSHFATRIKEIIGGAGWLEAVPISLTAVLAKFHQTTGHKHTGTAGDAPKLDAETNLSYIPVNRAGDTMTGLLTLSGGPTAALHAATKAYADTKLGAGGGNISGPLTISPPLPAPSGGTGHGAYAPGDMLYASSGSALGRRAIGAAGQVWMVSGGVPVWATLAVPPAPIRWLVQGTIQGAFSRVAQTLIERDVTFKKVWVHTNTPTGNWIVINVRLNGGPSIWAAGHQPSIAPNTYDGSREYFNGGYSGAAAGWRISLDIEQGVGGGNDLLVVVEFA